MISPEISALPWWEGFGVWAGGHWSVLEEEWKVAESKVTTEHRAIVLPGWVEYGSYKGLPRWY